MGSGDAAEVFGLLRAYGKPCLSVVSVVEILHGLHRDAVGGKAALFEREVGNDYQVLQFDLPAGLIAAQILATLDAAGKRIGLSDCLIAAVALDRNLELVTANTGHFQRIIDSGYPLKIQNWRHPG